MSWWILVSMKAPHVFILSLLFIQLSRSFGGKILVVPLDGSHWVNMKILIEELHTKGHEISVVCPSDSWYISKESPLYTSVNLPFAGGFEETFSVFLSQLLDLRLQAKPSLFWTRVWSEIKMQQMVLEHFSLYHKKIAELTVQILEDKKLIQTLHETKFDVVLTDPGIGVGTILGRWLQVPLVYNVRWTIQGEAHLLIAPSPLSYIPFTATQLTDKMTFPQRITNLLSYIFGMRSMSYITEPYYKPIVTKYFGPDVDYLTFFLNADIWLMRNDFIFEFPRPTMPNVIYISGFQCKPSKPLPADLEKFIQSSGDHGIIVMTLGTLVAKLPQHVAEEIAAAFAQLPQKVIWRYVGQRPANLGNNTLLVEWLPQNDLLGHPKTKAFVAHGGTNGVQEAIYHGVPVVGLPLFFDQSDNLSRIRSKGGAVVVDIAELNRDLFADALKTVLSNPSYRENMQRLSRLHRDQPIKPLDQAVFWTEYVIRHKGAAHLKAQSITMSWFVYYSIDVVVALLAAALFLMFTFILVVKFLWRIIFGKKIKHE